MHPIIHQNEFAILPNFYPKSIVSLVPSQTELLYYVGLDERVIGITKFCVHPAHWLQTKTIIGGTKKVDIEKIKQLKPDLILANKEENVKEQIEELAATCPVYVSDVNNVGTAMEMILQIGLLVHVRLQSELLVEELFVRFDKLQNQIRSLPLLTAAYFIWRKPYMAAGGGTFINDLLQRCGMQNVFGHLARYPKITIDKLQKSNCQVVLLSTEPYPFKQKHIEEIQSHLPEAKVLLVDGEMFSWYGSRLILAVDYFTQLLKQSGCFPTG